MAFRQKMNSRSEASSDKPEIPEVPSPPSEEWSVRMMRGPDSWELVATGPERGRQARIGGWQCEGGPGTIRYRLWLRSDADRAPHAIRRALRALIWHRIRFRPNPIDTIDPELAERFEHLVWDALRRQHGAVQVSFNAWRDGAGLRYVCKVEALPNGSAEAGRRWWSPLVSTPDELAVELAAAYPGEEDEASPGPVIQPLRIASGLNVEQGA